MSWIVSKFKWIMLVSGALIHGRPYMGEQLGVSVVADSVMALLFALYLVGTRRGQVAA